MKRSKGVYDPEIPVDIVNLGLVYEVLVDSDRIAVKMTTTAAGCPVGNYIVAQAKRVLGRLEGVKEKVFPLNISGHLKEKRSQTN